MNALLSRVVAGLALAAGAAVLFAPRAPAVAGGLLLGFVLPGMALQGVLFRRRALTAVESTVLTPALSMGVLIVAGLGLHVAGLRIDRLAWTVATVGVTLVAVATARLMRRRRPGAGPQPAGESSARPQPTGDGAARLLVHGPAEAHAEAHTVVMSVVPAVLVEEDERGSAAQELARRRRLLRQFLPLVMVAGVLAGASWLSFETSRATHDTVVTALSATTPGPVDAAGNRLVEVSATGLLAGDGPYTVSVTGPAGTATVKRTVPVTRDGTWSETLSLPGAQRMTVSLYRSGDTTAYRTLYLSAVD